jgi:hypothetical protein
MAAGTGLIIEAVDYTTIRNKIISIMGTSADLGTGQNGYGQILRSSAVIPGNQVTKAQWDNLRYDILNARIHQDGVVPTIVTATQGQPIRYGAGHPNNQYNAQADTAVANKWNLGTGQFVIDAATSATRTTAWNSNLTIEPIIVTFGTADQARYFFNSGSKVRCTSSRTGGTGRPQNSSWSNILDTAGTVAFGGNTSGLNFYNLTSSYQTFFNLITSAPYTGNQYRIEVVSNVADNSIGGATVLTFRVTYTDTYVYTGSGSTSFPDSVDGTLTLTVDELRASGTLQPLGTGPFVITRPAYSISGISGS